MQGTVSKKFTSKKGTACLEIGGQVYICPKVDIQHVVVGDLISYEGHSFGDGKMWEMDSFKLVQAATKYPVPQAASAPLQAYPASSQGLGPIPAGVASNGPTKALPGDTGLAVFDAERPCISNWGAELIKAGLIKDPADLGIWVTAIKNVLR